MKRENVAGKESHSLRNGIIGTVIGGIIVSAISPVRGFCMAILSWLWSGVVWVWKVLTSSYLIPGWVLLLVGVLALIGIITVCRVFRPENPPEFAKYTEDMIYGVKWKWHWVGNTISNLWCFCPCCDAQLVYDDSSCGHLFEPDKTDFICERCNNQIVGTVSGGNRSYAVGAAEREILRRIRTNEYKRA